MLLHLVAVMFFFLNLTVKNKSYSTQNYYVSQVFTQNNYVSQFTVETYCFADGRCLLKQPLNVTYHCNQYDEEISKKCRSVRLSVRL